MERAKPQSNVMTALKALISISRRLERFVGQKNMGAWRSSRAFETLMMRMLGLMAFSTTSGMGLLLLVKRNGDFGARTNPLWRFHLRLPCTCVHDFSCRVCTVPLDVERQGYSRKG